MQDAALNPNLATTSAVAISDQTTPTASSGGYVNTAPYTLTINFSEGMSNSNTGTGAANPANYTLDGSALPAAATVTCTTATCNVVTIRFNTAPAVGGHIVQVSGTIKDKQGTSIGSTTNIAFTQ